MNHLTRERSNMTWEKPAKRLESNSKYQFNDLGLGDALNASRRWFLKYFLEKSGRRWDEKFSHFAQTMSDKWLESWQSFKPRNFPSNWCEDCDIFFFVVGGFTSWFIRKENATILFHSPHARPQSSSMVFFGIFVNINLLWQIQLLKIIWMNILSLSALQANGGRLRRVFIRHSETGWKRSSVNKRAPQSSS